MATSGAATCETGAEPPDKLLEINHLIDLTSEPINLTRQDISWSRVRANASNCICCCCNNSITLVTTNSSYVLDQVPLNDIQSAQCDPSLSHLAIADHKRLAIVELSSVPEAAQAEAQAQTRTSRAPADTPTGVAAQKLSSGGGGGGFSPPKEVKFVDLSAHGLSMADVTFWRWLDAETLAILTYEVLYTCSLTQAGTVCGVGLAPQTAATINNNNTNSSTSTNAKCSAGNHNKPHRHHRHLSCMAKQQQQQQQQQYINHPAFSAFSTRARHLEMERVVEVHEHLSALCQVTDVQRDATHSLYVISSLYSTSQLLHLAPHLQGEAHVLGGGGDCVLPPPPPPPSLAPQPTTAPAPGLLQPASLSGSLPAGLRPSFGSVPSHLSQFSLAPESSFDSLRSDQAPASARASTSGPGASSISLGESQPPSEASLATGADEVCGLVQVYCRLRNRSQLLQAHAAVFTSRPSSGAAAAAATATGAGGRLEEEPSKQATMLVAANKIGRRMRVHFIEMATEQSLIEGSSAGKNGSTITRFERMPAVDFPTSIVCSHPPAPHGDTAHHLAFITTKHGQMFCYSVARGTLLFAASIVNDIISSTVLESQTQGLLAISRNGKVILVKLDPKRLALMLDRCRTLKSVSSSPNIASSSRAQAHDATSPNPAGKSSTSSPESPPQPPPVGQGLPHSRSHHQIMSASLDADLEVLMSTKL